MEWTGLAEIGRLEDLVVGNECCERLYSYSRFKKMEPLITLGFHQGGEGGGGS